MNEADEPSHPELDEPRTRTCYSISEGVEYPCTQYEYDHQEVEDEGPGVGYPTLQECQNAETHEFYVNCLKWYSHAELGDDPSLPPEAVSPQACAAWEGGYGGDLKLTPAQQKYCRDHP